MNITSPSGILSISGNGEVSVEDMDLLMKLEKWLQDAENSTPEMEWRSTATEDYNYYAGDQDPTEVVELLTQMRRPTSTFNEIKPKIDMLIGLAEQIRKVPYVEPVTFEDEALAELMNGAFKHYRRKQKISEREMQCFEHTVKSGRSFLNLYVNFSNPFEPDIRCKRIAGRDCYVDPNSVELDMSDARFFFVNKWFTEDDIKSIWPEFSSDIVRMYKGSSTSDMPTYFDEASDLYRIIECWYKKKEPALWFQNPITGEPESLSRKEMKDFTKALREGITLPNGEVLQVDSLPYVETRMDNVYYTIFSGGVILEKGKSPYFHKEFPFIQYGAYRHEDENRWFGAVTELKDPQFALNTMRRQLQHLLQTSPKGILMHEINAVLNIDEYDERSAEPNYRMEIADGKIEKVKFSQQPQISTVYSQLDTTYLESMKNISGAQDPLMGIQTSSREPGITARTRLESSIAVLYLLFNNFRESRIQGGKQLLSLIQQFIPPNTVIRIEGQEGMQLMEINSQMNPQLEGFNDISAGKFDLAIDEQAENLTVRRSVAMALTELSQNNPGSIPPEIIMEYLELPLTVKMKVQRYNEERMEREYELELAKIKGKEKSQ